MDFILDLGFKLLIGLSYSMMLFLLAMGLSLIFGLMDVMNLTHGSFYMFGSFLGLTAGRAWGGPSFWLAVLAVPILLGVVGMLLETTLLRSVYKRGHLDQVLLTLGLAYVASEAAVWIWGGGQTRTPEPIPFTASVDVFGRQFPSYRLFLIGCGLLIALAFWQFEKRSRIGAIIRAGVTDKEMVSGLGINITRVFTLVFAVGVALAGLGGVVAGPVLGQQTNMDLNIIILTLIVVVVGGLGTLKGAFVGSLVVGLADSLGQVIIPDFSNFAIYAVMALVLIVRPAGLFGRPDV